MLCQIYTAAGQFVADGVSGMRRDGTFELVPLHTQRALEPGEGPLVMVEGPRRYPVRVMAKHEPRDARRTGVDAVYHLAPLIRS